MITRYTHYVESLEAIKNATKWSLTDDFRRLMALNYAIHGAPFEPNRFAHAQAVIKQKTGIFSKFRGSQNFVWLSSLDAKYEDIEPAIDEVLHLDTLLDRKHFRFSTLRPFLAAQLVNVNEPEQRLDEASSLYQTFKKHHPWLTGDEDLLSALVLVQAFDDHVELNERIESYYQALEVHLPRSNELQLVSHLLTFSDFEPDEAVTCFMAWRSRLEAQQIRVKNEHLAPLALLSIVSEPNDTDEQLILDIIAAEKEQQRWFNTYGLTIALQLVAAENITEEASSLLIHGTFAHLMAMQQAASAAATVAIISSTSSNN